VGKSAAFAAVRNYQPIRMPGALAPWLGVLGPQQAPTEKRMRIAERF
jgi:hypothetical protein